MEVGLVSSPASFIYILFYYFRTLSVFIYPVSVFLITAFAKEIKLAFQTFSKVSCHALVRVKCV